MSMSKNNNMMFVIYVKDQQKSKIFYEELLGYKPILDVQGMTEFQLTNNVIMGIMPEEGIAKILENKTPHPSAGNGVPRCEIYFFVDNPDEYYKRLTKAGGNGISKGSIRSWGDYVAYGCDLDGHVIAFAKKVRTS